MHGLTFTFLRDYLVSLYFSLGMKGMMSFVLGAALILLLSYLSPKGSRIECFVNGYGISSENKFTGQMNGKSTIYLLGYAGEEPVIDVYGFIDNEMVADQVIEGLNFVNASLGYATREYIVK